MFIVEQQVDGRWEFVQDFHYRSFAESCLRFVLAINPAGGRLTEVEGAVCQCNRHPCSGVGP